MRNLFKFTNLGFLILTSIFYSCETKEVPTLTTTEVTNITGTTATSGGDITFDGGAMVSERGVCWSTSNNPTISDDKTMDGAGEGSYSSNITNLAGGTVYYVRAYATNSVGTGYGTALMFQTLGKAPTAKTKPATNVSSTSATLNGIVNGNYLSTVVTFEYGTTTNYGQSITATQSPVNGDSLSVSANLTGLTGGVTYHFRVVAVNSLGTSYGIDKLFNSNIGLGKSYEGGLIFYIDSTGMHGFIAAPFNQSAGIQWYNGTFVVTGATGRSIGTGQTNTNSIVAAQGEGNYAAKLCYDLELNGYSDWFLPPDDVWVWIHANLAYNNLGGFVYNSTFWSSSEISSENAYCYEMNYREGITHSRPKSDKYYVRAIRAF